MDRSLLTSNEEWYVNYPLAKDQWALNLTDAKQESNT
jgi:hypothetical protein